MSLQEADMIIKLEQELHIEKEKYLYVLENPRITSIKKIGSLNVSIVMYIDT